MHILSDVEHQRRNHPVASLRCHIGMLRIVIDCDDCCTNCNSTSSYQQSPPPLAALRAPPRSFGCGIGRLMCLACKCPLRSYSVRERIMPRRGASLLPQAIWLRYRLSLRSYTSSADPRPSEERRRKGAQGRHYVYTMVGRVQALQSLWASDRDAKANHKRQQTASSHKCRRSPFFHEGAARIGSRTPHPCRFAASIDTAELASHAHAHAHAHAHYSISCLLLQMYSLVC